MMKHEDNFSEKEINKLRETKEQLCQNHLANFTTHRLHISAFIYLACLEISSSTNTPMPTRYLRQ